MELAVDAVLFDNDGVLVDSHGQVDRAWTQLAVEFGLDIEILRRELVGARAVDTLGRHLHSHRLAAAVVRLEELEVELASTTRPLAGAVELTAALPPQSWAIVTSASRRLAEARWRGAGISAAGSTVTADDVTHGKPHPEPFLVAAQLLGVDPARSVVFEDSSPGAASGLAAGAQVVAVGAQPWGNEPLARVPDLSHVSVIASNGSLVLTLDTPA